MTETAEKTAAEWPRRTNGKWETPEGKRYASSSQARAAMEKSRQREEKAS